MAQLMFQKVRGKRIDSWLLYVPQEKHLYVKHRVVEGKEPGEDWICYQSILNKKDKDQVKCTSTVHLGQNNICKQKNIRNPHTNHINHELIYKDIMSLNKIKTDCINAKVVSDGVAMKISASDIFTRELSK